MTIQTHGPRRMRLTSITRGACPDLLPAQTNDTSTVHSDTNEGDRLRGSCEVVRMRSATLRRMHSSKGLGAGMRRLAGAARRRLPWPAARNAPAPAPRTAVLVVHGFDRKGRWGPFNEEEARDYPWVELCLRQIERHSRGSSYEVLVFDNSWLPEHREIIENDPKVRRFQPRQEGRSLRHGPSLDRLVKRVRPGTEFVITLDTDSFPIRDGWIENLTGRLTGDVLLAGVWRDEMLPVKPAFIHPTCLAIRRSTLQDLGAGFAIGSGADVASNITDAVHARGARTSKLWRSNRWNPHFLMGAVYGDLIYHQGAGSRAPVFSRTSDPAHDEAVRVALRNAAFCAVDDLVDVLTGTADPEVLPDLLAIAPPETAPGADLGVDLGVDVRRERPDAP